MNFSFHFVNTNWQRNWSKSPIVDTLIDIIGLFVCTKSYVRGENKIFLCMRFRQGWVGKKRPEKSLFSYFHRMCIFIAFFVRVFHSAFTIGVRRSDFRRKSCIFSLSFFLANQHQFASASSSVRRCVSHCVLFLISIFRRQASHRHSRAHRKAIASRLSIDLSKNRMRYAVRLRCFWKDDDNWDLLRREKH